MSDTSLAASPDPSSQNRVSLTVPMLSVTGPACSASNTRPIRYTLSLNGRDRMEQIPRYLKKVVHLPTTTRIT